MPTTASTQYTGSLLVSVATTIRAIAVDDNGRVSELQAQRYTFEKAPPVLTVAPASGNYLDAQQVVATAGGGTPPYTIYYTSDGTEPTTASAIYTDPIAVASATTLKFLVKDAANNLSAVVTRTYTFNIPAPVVKATPASGNFSMGNVLVTLTAQSPRPPVTIRYTTDGSTPDNSSPIFTTPIAISGGNPVKLKYFGVDAENRVGAVDSSTYSFFPIPHITVFFKRPVNWSTNIRIHFFNAVPSGSLSNSTWPGVAMQKVCGDWYSYTFSGVTSVGIVFNDGAGRQTADLSVTQTNWYNNGWLSGDPGISNPEADFSVEPGLTGTAPFTATFNGSLSTACNGIQAYDWDFGNGKSGSGPQPTTVFTQPGTYSVKLTVTDMEGKKGERIRQLLVTAAGEGFWVYFKKPDNWAVPVKIQYSNRMPGNLSIPAPGENMQQHCGSWFKYKFDNTVAVNLSFSDGGSNQFTGLHANQHTSFIGNKKVLGAPDSEQLLFANFEMTPATGKAPLQVTLNSAASLACNTITSYNWSFGNGSSSTTAHPVASFAQAGVYPVNLSITDNFGNSHQLTKRLVVGTAGGNVTVHFRRPPGWANVPRVYYWAPEPTVAVPAWPGATMTDAGNGWFTFTIAGANCANIIFNNNSSPQTADLLNICGELWYDNGWLSPIVADASLPVRLLSFKAKPMPQAVELLWQVEAEQDLDYYEVQRSSNGVQFTTIFTQKARNLPVASRYSMIDGKLPQADRLFYRLAAVNKEGSTLYSPIQKVNLQTGATWKASPNPAVSEVLISSNRSSGKIAAVRLTQASGKVVSILPNATGQMPFRVKRDAKWVAGLYFAELMDANGIVMERLKILFE